MIKAIIFDCFGVIRPDRLLLTYRKFGGDPEADRHFILDTQLASSRGMIPNSRTVYAERLGITVGQWMDALESGIENDTELLGYAEALRSKYRVGLLSNASKGRLVEVIGQTDLERCFDTVAESGEIGFAKPEARAYEIVADRLGVRLDECVMVDDNPDCCQGALAVGMQAIQYTSFEPFKRKLEQLLR